MYSEWKQCLNECLLNELASDQINAVHWKRKGCRQYTWEALLFGVSGCFSAYGLVKRLQRPYWILPILGISYGMLLKRRKRLLNEKIQRFLDVMELSLVWSEAKIDILKKNPDTFTKLASEKDLETHLRECQLAILGITGTPYKRKTNSYISETKLARLEFLSALQTCEANALNSIIDGPVTVWTNKTARLIQMKASIKHKDKLQQSDKQNISSKANYLLVSLQLKLKLLDKTDEESLQIDLYRGIKHDFNNLRQLIDDLSPLKQVSDSNGEILLDRGYTLEYAKETVQNNASVEEQEKLFFEADAGFERPVIEPVNNQTETFLEMMTELKNAISNLPNS